MARRLGILDGRLMPIPFALVGAISFPGPGSSLAFPRPGRPKRALSVVPGAVPGIPSDEDRLPVLHGHEEGAMRIAILGRGNVGGGLAERWERAGHEVMPFGRDGGDA